MSENGARETSLAQVGRGEPERRLVLVGGTEATPSLGRHLLVCLDRSAAAEVCIAHARALAQAFGSRLTLLHVLPSSAQLGRHPVRSDALDWALERRDAEAYLRNVCADLGLDADVRIEVTQGPPAERIAAAAHLLDADLVVLASHGEPFAEVGHVGATVHRVLASTRTSMFVARPGSTATTSPRRIVVPLDGSPRTESALPVVAALATAHDAEVLLVHVVAEPTATALLQSAEDLELARAIADRTAVTAERYLARLRERRLHELRAVRTSVVRHPDVAQALLESCANADLLVLTAHGASCSAQRSLGGIASHLLEQARVPTLVLQDVRTSTTSSSRPPPPAPHRFHSGVRPAEGGR